MKNLTKPIIYIASFILLINCSKENHTDNKIFTSLNANKSGIDFKNVLTENDSLNYFTYGYLYMGAGVSAGDINNDGLIDLYFTGNQVSNKLYLNKGNLQFEDITKSAGVGGDNKWYTGVTMADVNDDGFLDIYCSVSGKFGPRNNELYINNGNNTFSEKAKDYGIDDIGSSVQASFFDYDKDGDLDLYVANYPSMPFKAPVFAFKYRMANVQENETDHLYRNDNGSFTDVTNETGVRNFGLSLSATIGDLNNDGWDDIYVSNDFMSPDFMYLNNQDGTFKEEVKNATAHTAFYGMGADIADINNDGFLDIFQVDMDAENHRRQKANMASMNPDLFWNTVDAGFHYQYMHNTMQLNSGVFKNGIPHFSNVSRLTGTSSTDWSWGPLLVDLDNDGLKDLFVSNGTRREINNNDYFNKLKKDKIKEKDFLNAALNIPSERIDNFVFRNNGDLNFEVANDNWGISFKGFSNGSTYADLDNDGDLEIITNNIDDLASIFENKSSLKNDYLTIEFEGNKGNHFGLGNKVYVTVNDQTQMQQLTLTHGFQSSIAPELHFGLGQSEKIKELKVVWTDGKIQKLNDIDSNQKLTLKYSNAIAEQEEPINEKHLFVTDNSELFPQHKHIENEYDDFKDQVLLPHKMSTFGPAMAIGDLNNDGLDDYFIGGSKDNSGSIFIQTDQGFVKQDSEFLNNDKASEDIGALIFDADGDGDNDLYVSSGGYEFAPNSELLQDRLYINDGKGNFSKTDALPEMITSSSKIFNADFDKDGKQDLLVLGRQLPGDYPKAVNSYLLKGVGETSKPKFEIFNSMQPEAFTNLGMATNAVITDFNNDGWDDFIIVGEWMSIKVFKNIQSGFADVSEDMGLNKDTTGWWWSISEGDFDGDSDMDYVLGNNGLNYKYKANPEETFDIYVNDFDKNNKDDIVLSYHEEGKQYPVRGRGCSSQQIPGIKEKFENYESFAEATLVDVYTEEALKKSLHYQIKSFASIYLENKDGKFVIHNLPVEAQTSCINKILVDDYNKDGNLDILIAGNLYMSEVETPRNDAGYGLYLEGNGNGNFKPITPSKSGFFTPGDVKDMGVIKFKNTPYIISVKNDDYLQFIRTDK
ncbi:VCBS repeat-containing protein [Thalassobellus citreus]|uniref:VCBS repeat-containing protein n=1 Tax=Thalassobellus citreus TaxID=3367752 RepID=UPI0037A026FA